jgi:hypothetical protein
MRTEKLIVLCMVLFFVQLVACERGEIVKENPVPASARTGADTSADAARRIVTEKTSGIKQKEPVNFTLVAPQSPYVMWRVVPEQIVVNQGTQSVVYFQKAGNYKVFAIDSLSYDTTFIEVQVSDDIYTPPSGEQALRDDETLQITPSFYRDSANVLVLSVVTKESYNCRNNQLVTSTQRTGSLFQIQLYGVATNTACQPGENKPESKLYLINPAADNYAGEIEILFNNKTYKGSFKKTGNKYEFDWPHDTGAIFTTKSI